MSSVFRQIRYKSRALYPKHENNFIQLRLISTLNQLKLNQAQNLHNSSQTSPITFKPIESAIISTEANPELQIHLPLVFPPSKHLTELPFSQLLRSYFILNLCRNNLLVKNAQPLLNFSRNICGSYITKLVIKSSFFKHFCAGETSDEVINSMSRLQAQGIGSILDYAAEKDFNGDISEDTFEYFNNVKDNLKNSIIQTSHQKLGFIALKMTALIPVEDIYKASKCIVKAHNAYEILTRQSELSTAGNLFKDKVIFEEFDLNTFLEIGVNTFKDGTELNALFHSILASSPYPVDKINYYMWMSYFSPENPMNLSNLSNIDTFKDLPNEKEWIEGKKRLEEIIQTAEDYSNTAILIDAEQSYFQPAIDEITIKLQEQFNKDRCIVYNTYQAYRSDTNNRVLADMNRSKILNYNFGVKLVRGAYMNQERALANSNNTPDPIYATIEQTHNSFNSLVKILLTSSTDSPYLFLATHNENSIRLAAELQQTSHINKQNVIFAQLFGMADHITYSLSRNNFVVYKYLPYGPVFEVLPYLIRRAEENFDVMAGSKSEITNIKNEILSRSNPTKWLTYAN